MENGHAVMGNGRRGDAAQGRRGRKGVGPESRQKIRRDMEQASEKWPEAYYRETDREKRRSLLEARLESGIPDKGDEIRLELWKRRYGTGDRLADGVDYFIRSWMRLYLLSGNPGRPGGKRKKKELEQIRQDMGFFLAEEYGREGEEALYQEFCNGLRYYIQLCRKDKKYNSTVMGLVKLKPDRLAKKLGQEFLEVSVRLPEHFGMGQEFGLLKKACERVYREEFPGEKV